jgi:hypothetical protein
MNGWTLAGLLLGFMFGLYYGALAERRRLIGTVEKAKGQMLDSVTRFVDRTKKINEIKQAAPKSGGKPGNRIH